MSRAYDLGYGGEPPEQPEHICPNCGGAIWTLSKLCRVCPAAELDNPELLTPAQFPARTDDQGDSPQMFSASTD